MSFDILFAINILPIMMKYLGVTLSIAFVSIAIGLSLAFVIALAIHAKIPILSGFFKVYIAFFRGTPLMAQLFCVYFGLIPLFPALVLKISSFETAIFVMSLNSAAYMAESLRGAISSIEKGQMEASLSIGMSYFQGMRRIVLPQAVRVALPTLGSSFINVIKDSSLIFVIGVKEIMAVAQLEAASSYRYLEAFVDVLLVYWLLTATITAIQKQVEKRLNQMVGE